MMSDSKRSEQAVVSTVTGPVELDRLGRVLMHEHIVLGLPGWEGDTLQPPLDRTALVACICEKLRALQAQGFNTLVDPCPSDLGRDIELAVEVSRITGFQIICATGLYTEAEGGNSYWKLIQKCDSQEFIDRAARLFIQELTRGIGGSEIKAGVIKLGSDHGVITDYEQDVIKAAAIAHLETGAPITTHTDATIGAQQLAALLEAGGPAEKIVIGHSCGNPEVAYQRGLAEQGAYVGFDRFGYGAIVSDEVRVQNLTRLINEGHVERMILSHDCIFCTKGEPFVEMIKQAPAGTFYVEPTHLVEKIVPMLLEQGVTEAQIQTMLMENPKRYFSPAQ